MILVTAFFSLLGAVVLLAADQAGPWGPLWVILAVAFGALSALRAFGLEVPTGPRLELVLFIPWPPWP